ncbi:hypothetical protein AB3N60_10985 [Leptospira sp. WS39.C2]
MNINLINIIENIRDQFGIEYDRTDYYHKFIYISQLLSLSLILKLHPENEINSENLTENEKTELKKHIQSFYENYKLIGGKESLTLLTEEKVFLDRYSIFENFIFENFNELGKAYPNLLFKEKKHIKIKKEYLFTSKIEETYLAELVFNEIKETMFNKSLSNSIHTFINRFALTKKIEKEKFSAIDQISAIRNILIHKKGKISELDLLELKSKGIEINIEIEKGVNKFLSRELDRYQITLGDTAQELYESILDTVKKTT